MDTIFDRPLIGVVMCQADHHDHPVQLVHNKYLDAVLAAGGVPLALPHGLGSPPLLARALSALDGILLTGSPSNIEPHHYGEKGEEAHADPGRDRLAFALVDRALALQMPLLAICRGLQELVVASGGSLHRQVQLVPGLQDHRENPALPQAGQYGPAHDVWPEPGGMLETLLGHTAPLAVNSLHQQGVRSLPAELRVEARAADGLVEAVSHRQHPFAVAVQWHPEWHSRESALSRSLFDGFIAASQRFHQEYRT